MSKAVVSKTGIKISVTMLLSLFCVACSKQNINGGTEVIVDPGSSVSCSNTSPFANLDNSWKKCQTSTDYSGKIYRYSRWTYYDVVNKNVLPTDASGKHYIPAIGPAAQKDGVSYGLDSIDGWAKVPSAMSDCILESGGFWRRGFFIYKDYNGQITYNGTVLGATQNGLASVGFSGRSSNNWGAGSGYANNFYPGALGGAGLEAWDRSFDDGWVYVSENNFNVNGSTANNRVGKNNNDFIGEYTTYDIPSDTHGWSLSGDIKTDSLGQQSLWIGSETSVWAKMNSSIAPIDDKEAQSRIDEFASDSNPTTLQYGRYFMYDEPSTVVFCYSELSPFKGDVQIGNASNNYAFESKTYETSKSSGVYNYGSLDSSTHTIDLGKVSSNKYTPSQFLMKVAKDGTKSGNTSYTAKMTQDGATKYVFDGHNWASGTTPSTLTTSSSVASSASPEFTLSEGKNTLCVTLDYKEKSSSSSYQNLTACATVTYEPVVAAIDSTTSLTLNGVKVGDSGADDSKVFNYGDENYGKDVISAKWDYLLYSTGRCIESNFYATYCNPTVSTVESFKLNYKRAGSLFSDSDLQSASLVSSEYKFSPGSTTKTYSLLPGETIKAEDSKQGVQHRSGVRMNGDNATGSKDEESSVAFTATAKNVTCGINGKEFGLGNALNYGRLRVLKNGSLYGIYGNDEGGAWKDEGSVWLKPEDEVQLGYEACIGEQIAKDKNSGKSWEETLTDQKDNVLLAVGTTGSALDTPHYTDTGNAVNKTPSRNILSYEAIGNSINGHLASEYQFVGGKTIYSKSGQVGHVGQVINNDFGNTNDVAGGSALAGCGDGSRTDCYARATMKIPYNYVLEPKADPGSGEVVSIGKDTTFSVKVNKNDRVNEPVDGSNPYSTAEIKPVTEAKYLAFRLSSNDDAGVLDEKTKIFETMDGNALSNLAGIIHANLTIEEIRSGDVPSDKIGTGAGVDVTLNASDAHADYNKLCVAVGVYPADSHNYYSYDESGKRVWGISSTNQDNALTSEAGNGAFTRISVSCKTVGKYPTVSVEGNGIVAGGTVRGRKTTYGEQVFGSWSEYGLVANKVANLGSGASLAYANPQTEKNQMAGDINKDGLKDNFFDSPQTLGNMSTAVGLMDSAEASIYAKQMKDFASNIKSIYFAEKQACGSFLCKIGNTYVNTNFDDTVTIGAAEMSEINSHQNEDAQVFIYSVDDIVIKNEVTQLYANFIADGKVDTCDEAEHDDAGSNGKLVDNCYNVLVINGTVYSEDSIALDRVFGGGSSYGTMDFDPMTLIQRAEVFNYDPKIVKWGYDFKHEAQSLTTTYIEELPTRY